MKLSHALILAALGFGITSCVDPGFVAGGHGSNANVNVDTLTLQQHASSQFWQGRR